MNRNAYSGTAFGTLTLALWGIAQAAPVDEAKSLFGSVPAPPQTVAAAAAATQVTTNSGNSTLAAPAYHAVEVKLRSTLNAAAAPQTSAAGIDMARMQSDPAYAAQVQARMQSMSMAERMAMAQQMSSAAHASASSAAPASAFLGGQRATDQTVQAKMRSLLEGALASAGAQHKALDAQLAAQAKACPTDKTGWPERSCTDALGKKSIAGHRAIEDAALPQETKAFAEARALAAAEVAKTPSGEHDTAAIAAWIGTYTELLRMYGEAMTLRAGFWSHANSSKYTGQVSVYVDNPDNGLVWPLTQPSTARVGL